MTNTATPKAKRRLPVWAWVLIALVAVPLLFLLSPIFATASLVILITAIVALTKNTRTWLRLRNRKVAAAVTAASAIALLVTGSLSAAALSSAPHGVSADLTAAAATPTSSATPRPTATIAEVSVDDEATAEAFTGQPATVADSSATTAQAAIAVLATLEVKGRAPKTGYARTQFGQRWLDIDHNGCDTRNDTLARDLTAVVRSGACTVASGTLADPYTNATIAFRRGQTTSALVQIDHVVSLSDAWQTGAQQLTADQRATFANDPLNLLAVDGSANEQKGDGDAATWLPKNKAYRCAYVARQVSVKATYGLWVTQAEHDAIAQILANCASEPAVTSAYAAVPVPVVVVPAPAAPAPPAPVAPVAPAPAPAPPAAAAPAPAPPASNCDPNYADGCVPIASDVDCAGGSGNGPAYFDGVARVVGRDIYGLDRNGDGYACNS